ncbi:MAG: 50S ribosomal protein L15e [Candidatus Aenigmarchaeota archaeon]|nr:50S ribosomal protein L15e [Candidatus Aenigmarchaeota archaeon]
MYNYLKVLWKKPEKEMGSIYKDKLVQWRNEPVVTKLDNPTRLDRARSLGYKAKQGIIVARVKVVRGGRKTPKVAGGRRPKRSGRFFSLNKSKQQVAEEKASIRFSNMEVVNSYWVGEDGKSVWYEVILADRDHPSVKNDNELKWVSGTRGRTKRGLTSAGKKSRGLLHKGKKT